MTAAPSNKLPCEGCRYGSGFTVSRDTHAQFHMCRMVATDHWFAGCRTDVVKAQGQDDGVMTEALRRVDLRTL